MAARQARAAVLASGVLCAICGERDALDMDHIPPKSIFPTPRPSDLITVPACGECNGGASVNDEEFKVGLSFMAGADTAETLKLWEAGAMRTLRHNRRMHREVLQRIVNVEVRSSGGLYLGTQEAILIPRQPMMAVLERTVRGLYYHHFGECLGRRARVDAKHMERRPPQPVMDFMKLLKPRSVAGGAFRYLYGRADDAALSSLWFLQFFGAVPIMAFTLAAEDPWRPCS